MSLTAIYQLVAQPAVAADRFAREIRAFLTDYAARLRQLNGKALDGSYALL